MQPPAAPLKERAEITYRWERWRAICNGILETGATLFLLLIAVQQYQAGATAKAIVAAGGSIGLLVSPAVLHWVQHLGWPSARAASHLAMLGALCCLIMVAVPVLPVFVVGSALSMACASSSIPLLTQVYQENYPERQRGQYFSRTVMIRIGVAALFSEAAGQFLDRHPGNYNWLLVGFAGAFVVAAFSLARCPSRPLRPGRGTNPFRSLRFARQDPVFRKVLIAWMLMGSANLMMLPMRIEFLANPTHGMAMTPAEVAFLVGVVPNAARLFLSPLWGWLFDRMNFFVLRIALNLGFACGILAFFTSNSILGLILGGIVHGMSNAGGDVAWGLWVTKFAPPQRVADYMSVHTFFTGVRGVAAPLVAFHLIGLISIPSLALIAGGLIVLASFILVPEVKDGTTGRRRAPLVEEVID